MYGHLIANFSANIQLNQTKMYSFNNSHTGRLCLYSNCMNSLIVTLFSFFQLYLVCVIIIYILQQHYTFTLSDTHHVRSTKRFDIIPTNEAELNRIE